MRLNFPLVLLNVFSVFALAAAVACWFSALVVIHHWKMKTAVRLPLLLGLVVAGRAVFLGKSSPGGAVLQFAAVFLATSMAIAYVYGWAKSRPFDEDELHEGSGRFRPVMLVWTGCVAWIGIVALVNLAATGTALPVHVAGY